MSDYRDIALWVEQDSDASVIVCEQGVAFIPNAAGQELVGAFGRAAVERGRALLGFAP